MEFNTKEPAILLAAQACIEQFAYDLQKAGRFAPVRAAAALFLCGAIACVTMVDAKLILAAFEAAFPPVLGVDDSSNPLGMVVAASLAFFAFIAAHAFLHEANKQSSVIVANLMRLFVIGTLLGLGGLIAASLGPYIADGLIAANEPTDLGLGLATAPEEGDGWFDKSLAELAAQIGAGWFSLTLFGFPLLSFALVSSMISLMLGLARRAWEDWPKLAEGRAVLREARETASKLNHLQTAREQLLPEWSFDDTGSVVSEAIEPLASALEEALAEKCLAADTGDAILPTDKGLKAVSFSALENLCRRFRALDRPTLAHAAEHGAYPLDLYSNKKD